MKPKIYLDANIFIFAFENQSHETEVAREIFALISQQAITAVISELVVAELLVYPLRYNDARLLDIYSELLNAPPGIDTRPVDRNVLLEASRQRAIRNKTKLPDAIHVATATLNGCRVFVSRDRKLELPSTLEKLGLDDEAIAVLRALA